MDTKQTAPTEIALACDLHAINATQREQHVATAKSVFAMVQEVKTLPSGYAFRVPAESEMLLKAAEWITNERLCCPFFHFAIEIEANRGPFWIHLTGGENVQQFIVANVSGLLDEHVAEVAGLR